MSAKWLKNAIFYQIYPTSFYDSDADGIGDLRGIKEKIPYLSSLGVNAVWLNPFYRSPFLDGGYDVQDYRAVDPRFGTLQDFKELVQALHEASIHVVIDLVIGHTALLHPWFQESAKDERNEKSDWYIWTDNSFTKYQDKSIHGMYPRDGGYVVNYYACQPALNYGFNRIDEAAAEGYSLGTGWQMHYTDERLTPLREEIISIMKYWLSMGVDGFRVDMASSLVKNCVYNSDRDEDVAGIRWLWNKLMTAVREDYPDCVFISEWIYAKNAVGKCGFDIDLYSHDIEGYNGLLRSEPGSNLLSLFESGHSFFSPDAKGSAKEFIEYYRSDLQAVEGKGYVAVPSGSHDEVRVGKDRDEEELKVIFAFLLTLRQVPFLYYGDEIGMTHNTGLNKDGGYLRTGARTPMQWTEGKNRGFSENEALYLPVNDMMGQSVEAMEGRENSLLSVVRRLIALRKSLSCLNAEAEIVFETDGYPLIYRRKDANGTVRVILNPSENPYTVPAEGSLLLGQNVTTGEQLHMGAKSFAILAL